MTRVHFALVQGVLSLVLLAGTPVLAHAYLLSASPEATSVVTELPDTVVLTMSEPVEVAFSTLKVYALPDAPADKKALIDAAKALMQEKLALHNDEAERADAGVITTGRTGTLEIQLKPDLPAGTYVIMWRVLSADTHTTEDFTFFTYEPQP